MILFALGLMASLVAVTFFLVWRRKINSLGLPVLAAGSFVYLYVFQPAYLLATDVLHVYLSDWQITKTLLVCALMYSAFLWAWMTGGKRRRPRDTNGWWNYQKLYRRGLLLACFGIVLFVLFMRQSGGVLYFYSAPHGALGAWKQQTAWVYYGKLLVFPGLAMMLAAVLRGRASKFKWIGVASVAVAVLLNAVLMASRGTLFPLAVVMGVTSYLVVRKMPSTRTVIIGGVALCMAVLALVGYRSVLHLGKNVAEPKPFQKAMLAETSINDAHLQSDTAKTEFIYTAGIIETVDQTQRYNLGVDWLYTVTIHVIPRLLWPGKPYGWSIGITPEDMAQVLGWHINSGAAPSLVGDLYREFGLGSIFLWLLLGRFSRNLFDRAWYGASPMWQIAYVLFYAFSLNLFAQGFGQLLMFYLYTLVPALFLIAGCRRHVVRPLVERYSLSERRARY